MTPLILMTWTGKNTCQAEADKAERPQIMNLNMFVNTVYCGPVPWRDDCFVNGEDLLPFPPCGECFKQDI